MKKALFTNNLLAMESTTVTCEQEKSFRHKEKNEPAHLPPLPLPSSPPQKKTIMSTATSKSEEKQKKKKTVSSTKRICQRTTIGAYVMVNEQAMQMRRDLRLRIFFA